jgi:hypothetical protein
MLERSPHVTGRPHIGADQPFNAPGTREAMKARTTGRVFAGKEVVPRCLSVHFVNGGRYAAGPIGAKPDVVPAGWANTRIVEDSRARNNQLHRMACSSGDRR